MNELMAEINTEKKKKIEAGKNVNANIPQTNTQKAKKVEEEDDNEFANKKLRVLNYLEEVYEGEISVEGEVDREKLKYDALLLTPSW